MRVRGPLHGRANGLPFRQRLATPHADLIPIAQYGGARKGEHEAIGEFHPPLITTHMVARRRQMPRP